MQMERDRHGASATAAAASPPRNSTGFVGPFAHIRKKLDYSYHSCYTKERQWLQDSIIDDILGDIITRTLHATQDAHSILEPPDSVCTDPTNPWILFTAGVQGAGKFHAVRTLVQEGYLPLLGFIHVDTDRIRRMLPDLIVSPYNAPHHHEDTARPLQHQSHSESEAHMEHVTTTTTTDASDSTEKEAGYIAEIVTWAALYGGKNVILDAAMKNVGWYQRLFADLRAFFPSLRLALLHIIAPREAVFQWSMVRTYESRFPPHLITIPAYYSLFYCRKLPWKPRESFPWRIYNKPWKTSLEQCRFLNSKWTFSVKFSTHPHITTHSIPYLDIQLTGKTQTHHQYYTLYAFWT
jgi:hypothetical protein